MAGGIGATGVGVTVALTELACRLPGRAPPRRRPGPDWKGGRNGMPSASPSSLPSPNWAPAFAGVVALIYGLRSAVCGLRNFAALRGPMLLAVLKT